MSGQTNPSKGSFASRRVLIFAVLAIIAISVPVATAVYYAGGFGRNSAETELDQQLKSAMTEFENAIKLAPNSIDGYRYLGSAYQMANRFDDEVAVWQRAAKANPDQAWPLVELGRVYDRVGQPLKARDAYYEATNRNPQDTTASQELLRSTSGIAAGEAIRAFLLDRGLTTQSVNDFRLVNEPMPNGWTFVGYQADPNALVSGVGTTLWSFWQSPTADTKPSLNLDSWIQVASNLWAHNDYTGSLLTGGAFEQPEPGSSNPAGFPNDIYRAPGFTRQMRRIERDGAPTTIGVLINDPENRSTSFASSRINVRKDTGYLLSGLSSSVRGNPQVGWHWFGQIPESVTSLEGYTKPILNEGSGWSLNAGLAVPPPGATGVQVWLTNSGTDGAAYFDDTALIPLPLPAPMWPGALNADDARAAQYEVLFDRYREFPASLQDPTWQAQLAQLGPSVRAQQPLENGWTFLGYHTQETALANGEQPPLILFWSGSFGAVPGSADDGWIDLHDGRWAQIIDHPTNLAPFGTFEAGMTPWRSALAQTPEGTRSLTVTTRSGLTTTVGLLANTAEYSTTSFISDPIGLEAGKLYLQTGWLDGPGSRGYIGRNWLGDIPSTTTSYSYIAAAEGPVIWRLYAGIAEPPAGATAAQLWLLNYLSESPAAFDNVLFVPITAPVSISSTQIATSGDSALALELLTQYGNDSNVPNDETWLANVAQAGPTHPLGVPIDEQWTLLGYSADDDKLAAGIPSPAFFFWQGPESAIAGEQSNGWYSLAADTWLQIVGDATSLLPNGDLELAADDPGSASFPLDYATTQSALDRTTPDLRDGNTSTVLSLANQSAEDTNGVASSVLPVDSTHYYLLSAILRTLEGGNPILGVNWVGDAIPAGTETAEFVDTGQGLIDWRRTSGVFAPVEGASGIQVAAYNYLAPGEVQLDNIVLLPIALPAPIASGLAGAAAATPDSAPEDTSVNSNDMPADAPTQDDGNVEPVTTVTPAAMFSPTPTTTVAPPDVATDTPAVTPSPSPVALETTLATETTPGVTSIVTTLTPSATATVTMTLTVTPTSTPTATTTETSTPASSPDSSGN